MNVSPTFLPCQKYYCLAQEKPVQLFLVAFQPSISVSFSVFPIALSLIHRQVEIKA